MHESQSKSKKRDISDVSGVKKLAKAGELWKASVLAQRHRLKSDGVKLSVANEFGSKRIPLAAKHLTPIEFVTLSKSGAIVPTLFLVGGSLITNAGKVIGYKFQHSAGELLVPHWFYQSSSFAFKVDDGILGLSESHGKLQLDLTRLWEGEKDPFLLLTPAVESDGHMINDCYVVGSNVKLSIPVNPQLYSFSRLGTSGNACLRMYTGFMQGDSKNVGFVPSAGAARSILPSSQIPSQYLISP
jgi:hypothetical protein